MSQVNRQRDITTGSEAVWQVLAAFDRIADWAPNVDHSCLLTDQEWGVGAVRRVQIGRAVLTETVQSWEPGSSLSYTITGLPTVVRSVVNTWRLDPFGAASRVTLTTDIDIGRRPPQLLIARIIGRKLAEASDEMLDGLVAHITHLAHIAPKEPTHE
jgi:carbon monoxide dehydrogenase subunit G